MADNAITTAQQKKAEAEGQSVYSGQKQSVAKERKLSDQAYNLAVGDTRNLGASALKALETSIAESDARRKARLGFQGLGGSQTGPNAFKTGDRSIVDLSGVKAGRSDLVASQKAYTSDKVSRLNSLLDSNKYSTNQKLDAYKKALPGLISELAESVANHEVSKAGALAAIDGLKAKLAHLNKPKRPYSSWGGGGWGRRGYGSREQKGSTATALQGAYTPGGNAQMDPYKAGGKIHVGNYYVGPDGKVVPTSKPISTGSGKVQYYYQPPGTVRKDANKVMM